MISVSWYRGLFSSPPPPLLEVVGTRVDEFYTYTFSHILTSRKETAALGRLLFNTLIPRHLNFLKIFSSTSQLFVQAGWKTRCLLKCNSSTYQVVLKSFASLLSRPTRNSFFTEISRFQLPFDFFLSKMDCFLSEKMLVWKYEALFQSVRVKVVKKWFA